MKTLLALPILILSLSGWAKEAAPKTPAERLLNACEIRMKAQTPAELKMLMVSVTDYCECVVVNHMDQAGRARNETFRERYLNQVLSFYENLNDIETDAARAKNRQTDRIDANIQVGCNKR